MKLEEFVKCAQEILARLGNVEVMVYSEESGCEVPAALFVDYYRENEIVYVDRER